MRIFIRGFLLLIFSSLFGLLISNLFAHAETPEGFRVTSTDKYYPLERWTKDPRWSLTPEPKRGMWFDRQPLERRRVLFVSGIDPRQMRWNEFDTDIFLGRVTRKGARGVASVYPKIPKTKLEILEREIRKVKDQ